MPQLIIFTDLDGTLLDYRTAYSFDAAAEALGKIKEKNIPLVICTSKTRAEIEVYKKKLRNNHPFISENGGGIFIPKEYFDFRFDYTSEEENYYIIKLGKEYENLRKVIDGIKKEGIKITGFGDMTAEEVAKDSGLNIEEAELSKKREFDEPFIIDENDEEKVKEIISKNNLTITKGGKYYHIMGNSDKGKAVKILVDLYKKKYEEVRTIGLGDSKNDFKMLDAVDTPFLVQKKDGSYASDEYQKAKGIGPDGWNKAVLEVIR